MQQIVKKRGKKNAKISVIQSLTTNIDKVSTPDKLPSNLILHLKKKKDSIIKSDDTFSENQHRGTPQGTQCGHRKHTKLHTKSLKIDIFMLSNFKSLRISE